MNNIEQYNWLVVKKHLEKWWSSSAGKHDIPCMKWKIIHMFETTNQVLVLHSNAHDFELQTHWHFVVLKSDCIGVDAMLNDNKPSQQSRSSCINSSLDRVGDLVFAQTSQLPSYPLVIWMSANCFFRRGPSTSMVIYPLKIQGDFPVHPIEPRVLKSHLQLIFALVQSWSNGDVPIPMTDPAGFLYIC